MSIQIEAFLVLEPNGQWSIHIQPNSEEVTNLIVQVTQPLEARRLGGTITVRVQS